MAVLVPGSGGRARIAADDDFEFGIRRIRCEIFVGIYVDTGGMIDGEQSHLIEVDGFFEWLHEAEAESLALPVFASLVILSRRL